MEGARVAGRTSRGSAVERIGRASVVGVTAASLVLPAVPVAGAQTGTQAGTRTGSIAVASSGSKDAPGSDQAGVWFDRLSSGGSAYSGSSVPQSSSPVLALPSPAVVALGYLTGSVSLGSTLGVLQHLGSADFDRSGSVAAPGAPVGTPDPAITSTRVVRVEPMYPGAADPELARAEIWTVSSAAMNREIRVEVYRAPGGVRAPMTYFLDGVESRVPSGWTGNLGFGSPEMRAREVTVVVPTGAPSSMFTDWVSDDPQLGRNRWETFLRDELPPLVESKVPNNGRWGAVGVSMGAGAAVHLAATSSRFSAAAGISGCYSTLDEIGYQYARLTAQAHGGDPSNMWGPRGSGEWARHDTVSHPDGLRGKTVYLSAATGYVGSTDLANFGSNSRLLAEGGLLEKGSYECTQALVRSLDTAGVTYHVDWDPTGIHNWPEFEPRMVTAFDTILPALAG